MSPAPSQTAPLRTLANLATVCPSLCVGTAAFVLGLARQVCLLLFVVYFAVFQIILPTYINCVLAFASRAIPRLIESQASAITLLSAAALAFALAGATDALTICTLVLPVDVAARLSRRLLAPTAAFFVAFAATAAATIAAYDDARASV
eukprot:4472311-Pleurochrysis_carterae.AAC.1